MSGSESRAISGDCEHWIVKARHSRSSGGAAFPVRSTTGVSARGASITGGASSTGVSSNAMGKKRERPTIPAMPAKRHKADHIRVSNGPKEDLEKPQVHTAIDDKSPSFFSLGNTAEELPDLFSELFWNICSRHLGNPPNIHSNRTDFG